MADEPVRHEATVSKVWSKPLSHWVLSATLPSGREEFLGYYPRREAAEKAEALAKEAGWQAARKAYEVAQVLQEDRVEYPRNAREVGQMVTKRAQTYRCASVAEEQDQWVTHCAHCGERFTFATPLSNRDGAPEVAFRARMFCDQHQLTNGAHHYLPPHPASVSRGWSL
ncbi:hypothetical protein UFOVP6_4 [uncultured Caudovirales phage]|uniref:Uncharacterized protein n=1 Tax=uncultured Caudovirales phage TaxID=2100421 RepID=A0A6J5KGF4_9CAUD|nr:hypothetical protein UFOVP6_4 [uncultured Caudovirales phage]